jgi:isopenicillin N synthase-like dioxygenase
MGLDYLVLTILAPGTVSALEVANRSGQWIIAPPKPGTFVVNVGDQLQALTNGVYVSTRHRVMNYSGKERYSVPFFFMPNYETIIKPIPELIIGKPEATYPVVSAGKVSVATIRDLQSRLASPSHHEVDALTNVSR